MHLTSINNQMVDQVLPKNKSKNSKSFLCISEDVVLNSYATVPMKTVSLH